MNSQRNLRINIVVGILEGVSIPILEEIVARILKGIHEKNKLDSCRNSSMKWKKIP